MRWLLGLALLAPGCTGGDESAPEVPSQTSAGTLRVLTVNYPLQYFAERIGGEHVEVSCPACAAADPAYWRPSPDDIVAYQRADVILLNGAGYAKWIATASLPESKLVDTAAGFAERTILVEDAVVHSHGPEGEHSHGETAFTTWLDPTLALEHAAAIRDALIAARPELESSFHDGFAGLEEDLTALDARLEAAVTGGGDVLVVGSHPVYQYFGRRYGLPIPSVHFEPDTYPDPAAWDELAELLQDHRASWMIWEAAPLTETSERLKELGVESAVVDPCATPPPSGDFLSTTASNAAAIESVFSES